MDDSANGPEEIAFKAVRELLVSDDWRQRVVEQVRPISPDHYEVRSSFQVEIPPSLVEQSDEPPESILLPVSWLPKQPLLAFDLTDVDGRSLTVLPRRDTAGVVGRVIHDWQIEALDTELFSIDRLVAAAAASLGVWTQTREPTGRPDSESILDYVYGGTGMQLGPHEGALALQEGRDLTRSGYQSVGLAGWWSELEADNPAVSGVLLCAYANPQVASDHELVEWISAHHESVGTALGLSTESSAARDWLRFFLRAGVRWPVLVVLPHQPGEQLLFKMREVRPSGHANVRRFVHDSQIGAAQSFHLQIHSPDPAIVIARTPIASSGPGQQVGFPDVFETMRQTDELFTTYTNNPGPDRVRFEVRFGLRPQVWAGYAFSIAISLVALVAAVLLKRLGGAEAAVLTIPTSLAATFVVARESTLTARYLAWQRRSLLAGSFVVWVVVIWRMLEWPSPIGR